MRIAQIATVGSPVREHGAESVEGHVWLLTRELTRLGHDVTVFAVAGSEACGEVVETLPGPYAAAGSPHDWQSCEWINLCRAVEQSDRFDVLHSHAYLWGLTLDQLSQAPIVHTMHVTPYEDHARLWRLYPDAHVTAISQYQWHRFPELHPCAIIHHGVDPAHFTFQSQPEDYVCYLGRFMADKGPLQAIAAARELGIRILLAGPRNDYYHEHIEPLVDGRMVAYAGYVTGAEKDALLGGARALLYPVQDPEPFGLVLIEAMMCGTPVVAMPLGAVAEIIEDGITGYCARSTADFPAQALRSIRLDRNLVREHAQVRFSVERMALAYESLYNGLTIREPVAMPRATGQAP